MDAYDYKARFAPISVIALPFAFLGCALLGAGEWKLAATLLVSFGGLHLLLMQFVRDHGFGKQEELFRRWGGSPTIQLLRWNAALNPILIEQRHVEVTRATGIELPDAIAEASDTAAADFRYEAAVAVLRDRTRGEGFALVSRQNANYGYRRNLYGCRSIGVAVSMVAAVLAMGVALSPFDHLAPHGTGWLLAASGASVVWVLMWLTRITDCFVRRAADQYALGVIEAAGRVSIH